MRPPRQGSPAPSGRRPPLDRLIRFLAAQINHHKAPAGPLERGHARSLARHTKAAAAAAAASLHQHPCVATYDLDPLPRQAHSAAIGLVQVKRSRRAQGGAATFIQVADC